jgi:hypothetical protein
MITNTAKKRPKRPAPDRYRMVAFFLIELIFLTLIAVVFIKLSDLPKDAVEGIKFIPTLPSFLFYLLLGLIVALLALSAASVLVILWRWWKRRRLEEKEQDPIRLTHVLGFIIVTVSLVVFIAALIITLVYKPDEDDESQGMDFSLEELEEEEEEVLEEEGEIDSDDTLPPSGEQEGDNRLLTTFLSIGAVVLFVVVLILGIRLLRSSSPPAEEEEGEDEEISEQLRQDLAAATARSLEQIMAEKDYRRAVIACYARMEEVFARHGYPRPAHLTPTEYLTGIVATIGQERHQEEPARQRSRKRGLLASVVANLIQLYVLAKFSIEDIGSKDKSRAIRYLVEIRDALIPSVKGP